MSDRSIYTINFHNVSVSAVQDLIAVYAGASMAFEVVGYGISPGNTTVENLQLNLKRLPATVTAGSGGTTPTPVPDATTGPAATVTAHVNDTTQATTSGTAVYLQSDGLNEVNGFEWIWPEKARPSCKLSEAIVLELASAPGGARTLSGWMKIRELF